METTESLSSGLKYNVPYYAEQVPMGACSLCTICSSDYEMLLRDTLDMLCSKDALHTITVHMKE